MTTSTIDVNPSNCMPAVIRTHTLLLALPLVYLSSWQLAKQNALRESTAVPESCHVSFQSMHWSNLKGYCIWYLRIWTMMKYDELVLEVSCFQDLLPSSKRAPPSNSLDLGKSHVSNARIELCSWAAKLHAQQRGAQSRQMYQCLSVRISKSLQAWQKENE